jgi:hypothetical protein
MNNYYIQNLLSLASIAKMVVPLCFLARFLDCFVIHQSGIYFQSDEAFPIGYIHRLYISKKFYEKLTYVFLLTRLSLLSKVTF